MDESTEAQRSQAMQPRAHSKENVAARARTQVGLAMLALAFTMSLIFLLGHLLFLIGSHVFWMYSA